ncbi:MAG: 4Fe-4S binding protein [Bryobacterales bacterium]|nr:4Fe-4S binding protein [Bryobacterales bacterium]
MAYQVTDRCSRCGACLDACPNDAILSVPAMTIDPLLCTECLGYSETPACVPLCPDRAIVPLTYPESKAP